MKIRQALLPLGFRVKTVGREDYESRLGLAGVKGMEELPRLTIPETGCADFDDEMAVRRLTSSRSIPLSDAAKKGVEWLIIRRSG
ncbi:MAG: hypothetical protein ACLUOI_24945 [Eisenbergiella sp.]